MKCALLPFSLAVALLAGCVRFESKPLSADRTADAFEARSLADPGLRAYLAGAVGLETNAPGDRAWTLDELTAVALYFHAEFELEKRRAGTVAAGVLTARELPNPILSVEPGYNTTSSGISPWIVGLGVGLPVETAGKRGYRTDEASHRAQAARLAVASAAWQVRRGVREAAVELAEADDAGRVESESARAQDALAALMERQRGEGEVSAFDTMTARMTADRAGIAVREAAGRAAVARVRLASALGLPSTAVEGLRLRLAADPGAMAPPDVAAARRAAMTGRADLLAALAEYAACQSALQLAIAGQYPDLELGPGYEFDQDEDKWSLGVSLTLPIFNRNRGAIGEALARREEAAAAVRVLQDRIAGEVDAALAECLAARDRAEAASAILDSAARRQAAVEAMRDAGAAAGGDVLAARAEAARSQVDAMKVRWELRRALGRLEDSLQRPADLPQSVLNAALNGKP
jgi:outer membrane protein TolC